MSSGIIITIMAIVIAVLMGLICSLCKEVQRKVSFTEREREVLKFIVSRLINLYGEKENVDYMVALKRISDK